MPGSPASKTTCPGTKPPPKTLSNSPIPDDTLLGGTDDETEESLTGSI